MLFPVVETGPRCRRLLLCLLICFSVFSPSALAIAADQEPPRAADQTGSQYLGIRKCKLCHDRKQQEDPLDQELGLTEFVKLGEFHTWYDRDKHARAHRSLTDAPGRQMGKYLGFDVAKDTRCLSCHATLYGGALPPEPELRFGVTCEGCHGAAGRWFLPHMDPPWRVRSSPEKEQLGMLDLRQPARRARQCFSCHVGNAGEGKTVTHDMYAAGHPPLPGVEVETFLDTMPPHWMALGEKKDSIKRLLRYDPRDLPAVKSLVIGGVLALREAVNFFGSRMSAAESRADFALYDCYGCHHDLKLPSWRQERGYRGIPGRPQLSDWPHALVRLAIFHTSRDSETYQKKSGELRARIRRLDDAVAAKPFGDPEKLGDPKARTGAVGEVIAWLDGLIVEVAASRLDHGAAARLLHRLTLMDDRPDPDYDSARQIAWAMVRLYSQVKLGPDKHRERSSSSWETSSTWNCPESARFRPPTIPNGSKSNSESCPMS
jgi:hypothetical protein